MQLASAAPAPPPLEPQPSEPTLGGLRRTPNTKRCTTCRRWIGLTQFHRNPMAKDGRQNTCSKCRNRKARAKNLGDAFRRDVRPKKTYSRNCYRCNEPYKGRGRLLCDGCLDLANLAGPMAEAAGDGCFRATARRGA